MAESVKTCPLCGEPAGNLAFPFCINYLGVFYEHRRCTSCATVFVDPLPDVETFRQMYASENYHDLYYADPAVSAPYRESVQLLKIFASAGATVLDYGCGSGQFLQALKEYGFNPLGVEFDAGAVQFAAKHFGVSVCSVDDWLKQSPGLKMDVIHLGDVLEHLPDPAATLTALVTYLKPGGLMFLEGPLEENSSLVLWAARSFGRVQRLLRPGRVGAGVPTHLFRTHAQAQRAFLLRVLAGAVELHWQVYETGWPYAAGSLPKRLIAVAAQRLSGFHFMGSVFGNRFRALFRIP